MRVGIVTLPLYHNYGGLLQNFALQRVLRNLGHTPITIDRVRKRPSWFHYYGSMLKCGIFKIFHIKTSKHFVYQHYYRKRSFRRFLRKNLSLTSSVYDYTIDVISQYHFEALLVGSDQVWRRSFHTGKDIKNYFLYFAKSYSCIKIAYAASFGVDYWEYEKNLTESCRDLVQDFNGVSTREDSGVELCHKYLDIQAIPVSDPTLLLDKDVYSSLCQKEPKVNQSFLLAYILDPNEETKLKVEQVALKLGYPIKYIYSELNASVSIEQWLSMFRDASFVVTDSFHGSVFSIIFNRRFVTIINEVRGSDRIYSLLSRFSCLNHIYQNGENIDLIFDWDKINRIKEEWQEKSINFLLDLLNNKTVANK